MTTQNKSILDHVKKQDFPRLAANTANPLLNKVSECPKCGAPIYGPSAVNAEQDIAVRYSCQCKQDKGGLSATMRTT